MRGLIVKGIGGFYYVKTDSGIIQAKGRGIFKKQGLLLKVGDIVDVQILPDKDGVIDSVEPRKNHFDRPPIANVDAVIIVFSAAQPKPNFSIVDKFLITAEKNDVEPILVMNKSDLISRENADKIRSRFTPTYRLISVSAVTGEGVDELKHAVEGKKCAFAGPSGVGKSSLTNLLIPDAKMEVGRVSTKANRGRHTTRHVEIFETEGGGLLFDTPGFTSFDISGITPDDLASYYPEIAELKGKCRFDDCRHIKEPDCAVRRAADDGTINRRRYESYKRIFEELKEAAKF